MSRGTYPYGGRIWDGFWHGVAHIIYPPFVALANLAGWLEERQMRRMYGPIDDTEENE